MQNSASCRFEGGSHTACLNAALMRRIVFLFMQYEELAVSCKFKLLKIVNEKALYGACEDTQINL